MCRLGVQSQPEGIYHFEDGVEIGTAFTGKRFVETFARQTRITSNLPHAPGSCNIAKRFGDERCVTFCLVKAGLQIGCHFFRCPKVFGDVVASSLCLTHRVLLQVVCKAQCSLDVGGLCALVTACQQNHDFAPVFLEVHPITGAIIDPQFGNAFANRRCIPGITRREAFDPCLNPCSCANVTQAVKPSGESVGLANLDHEAM